MTRDNFGTNNYTGYNGNRLTAISGFTNSSYGYDANGNLTSDSQKDIILGYNFLNLPQTVTGSQNLTYTYNAAGEKLQKQAGGTTTNYIDGIQYTNNSIDFIQTEEGLARKSGSSYSYEYNLTDHLGNVRVTFYQNPTTNQLEVLQRDDYYAFGLRKEPVAKAGLNKYLYNGKELQEELKQYDYGARFYDPIIGRWNVVDPKAEVFVGLSPYNYVLNNPISFVDPDGEGPSDPPTFLQKLLAFFGVGPANQPRSTEEAQEYSQRQSALFASNQRIEKGANRIQEGADWVPFLGATMHLSKAGITHSKQEAGIGFGIGMLDAFGGKLLGKGAKVLSGVGKEILEKVVGKVGNIAEHLTTKDMTGAIRDIFKDPVIINGKQYDHLGEVNDALKGLGKQIEKLNKEIKNGSFSEDVLEQAQKLRSSLQKEKDRIQDILNKAKKAANE